MSLYYLLCISASWWWSSKTETSRCYKLKKKNHLCILLVFISNYTTVRSVEHMKPTVFCSSPKVPFHLCSQCYQYFFETVKAVFMLMLFNFLICRLCVTDKIFDLIFVVNVFYLLWMLSIFREHYRSLYCHSESPRYSCVSLLSVLPNWFFARCFTVADPVCSDFFFHKANYHIQIWYDFTFTLHGALVIYIFSACSVCVPFIVLCCLRLCVLLFLLLATWLLARHVNKNWIKLSIVNIT
jgi:hypothetical protein